MTNCKDAQEQGKTFHYVWLLFSILLVAGKLSEDSQFLNIDQDLLEATKYTLLWAIKDTKQIHVTKVFWVLKEASIQMWISKRPQLSPTVYTTLQRFAEFKVDMHNLYVRARKDIAKEWMKLLFISTDDAIFTVLETWPPEWHAPDLGGMEKATAQQRKEDAKLHIMQLAKKRWQEKATAESAAQKKMADAAAVAQRVDTTTSPTEEAEEGHEMSTGQGAKDTNLTEEHADLETTSQQLKRSRVPKRPVHRNNIKALKTSIDPITLTEGDIFHISKIVHDVTKDTLQEVLME